MEGRLLFHFFIRTNFLHSFTNIFPVSFSFMIYSYYIVLISLQPIKKHPERVRSRCFCLCFCLCFCVNYFAQFALSVARLSIISLGILSPKFSA